MLTFEMRIFFLNYLTDSCLSLCVKARTSSYSSERSV